MIQACKTNYRGSGKWAGIARALNAIGEVVNSFTGDRGVDVHMQGGRVVFSGAGGGGGVSIGPLSLRTRLVGSATAHVSAGTVRAHGVAIWRVADQDVVLTAATSWVVVQIAAGTSTGSTVPIVVMESEPPIDSVSFLRIPLAVFERTSDDPPRFRYGLDGAGLLHPGGDIHLAAPLR